MQAREYRNSVVRPRGETEGYLDRQAQILVRLRRGKSRADRETS